MMYRREFIKIVGAGAVTALWAPSTFAASMSEIPFGLQLYTVRKEMNADPAGTLKALAKMGFQVVESAGYSNRKYYGLSPNEFKSILNDLGLKIPSSHYSSGQLSSKAIGTMANGWELAIEDAQTMGQKYMTLGWLAPGERKTLEDYKRLVDLINKCSEMCQAAGLQFAYHNHDFEFAKLEDQIPFNLLLRNTDTDLVKMELDLYWITKADQDLKKLIAENSGRFPLWHVKDMDNTPKRSFTEVGTGIIDFESAFKLSGEAGLEYYFIEQDHTEGSAVESAKTSLKNLQNLLK